MTKETFYTEKGKGGFVNKRRIRVSSCDNLENAVEETSVLIKKIVNKEK